MRIATKLGVGLGTVILILIVVSVIAMNAFRTIEGSAEDIATFKITALTNAQNEATAAVQALALQKDFLRTNDDGKKNATIAAIDEVAELITANLAIYEQMQKNGIDSQTKIANAKALLEQCAIFKDGMHTLAKQLDDNSGLIGKLGVIGGKLTSNVEDYYDYKSSLYRWRR